MTYELPADILKEKHGKEEYRLQVACVDYLKGQIRDGRNVYHAKRPFPQLFTDTGHQRFSHIFQGRNEKDGFFLKMMGLRRGLFDLLFWPGFIGFIDLKVGTGLTKEQKQFQGDVNTIPGVLTATASSVANLRDVLIRWGLTCENRACIEPPASLAKQQQSYLDMMRPL